MKNTKVQRGITLIALIITIIILLILAVVTIGSIKDSKIITYAQNAASDYEQGKGEEQSILSKYEELIKEQQVEKIGAWELQEDGETIKNKKTEEIKKIGDTFKNDEVLKATGGTQSTYTGIWAILGVENGKLKLVSTTDVSKIELGVNDPNVYIKDENGNSTKTLRPEITIEIFDSENQTTTNFDIEKCLWSYNHSEETLNEEAIKGTGIISARSIKSEDLEVENVLNITNEQKIKGNSYYGRIYKYYFGKTGSYEGIHSKYLEQGEEDKEENWSGGTLGIFDEIVSHNGLVVNANNKDNILKYTDNHYEYKLTEEQKTKWKDIVLNDGGAYWLASPRYRCVSNTPSYVVPCYFGNWDNEIMGFDILYGNGTLGSKVSLGVRAIVCI